MSVGCIPDFVNSVECSVQRRVVADGFIRTDDIVIDGSRDTNHIDAMLLAENIGAGKGTIAPDGYERIYVILF